MQKFLFTFALLFIVSTSIAQEGLGYYYDYYNHFYVFDQGKTIQLESNPVDSIRVGNDYLAYISQGGNLKIYYNGLTETLEENIPNQMIGTANAFVYKMAKRLMIYEGGEKKKLSGFAQNYYAGDNIVTWQDGATFDIMAYQNGEIKAIETGFSVKAINNAKTGKNVFAYNDLNNELKIFFNDKVYDTGGNNIRSYKCGLNTVAYIDRFNNTFNVFYNGEITQISDHVPKSYSVADEMVTYMDINDNFMLYYAGKTVQLETYVPSYQVVKDNLIVYYNEPELKIVYGGMKYNVDKFLNKPGIVYGINSILYYDANGRPKYFYKGKTIDNITTEPIREMYLYRDLPVLMYGTNTIGFYYDGQLYEYETAKTY